MTDSKRSFAPSFHRAIWRWHFYASLFVMPLILILATTGAIYLFKPQLDRWQERSFQNLPFAASVSPTRQLGAAKEAFPDAQFVNYRLPEFRGDAAIIHVAMPDGSMRDIFVSPQGKVLGSIDPDERISAIVARIHGSLFAGRIGDWIVELAACWAIVMVLTGLYLWWPRDRRLAGVLWPRWGRGGRAFLRDLHAVTGFWVSGLALVLLLTGLPWASVWGEAFRMARTELGLMQRPQNWKSGSGEQHAEHDHEAMVKLQSAGIRLVGFDQIVANAKAERLPFPFYVIPPGSDEASEMVWTVKSSAQNRPLNATITYDVATGKELSRSTFADKHVIDRAVNYGIAWHEGQLFGWINQLIGVVTALALITLTVTGFLMWRKRKPDGVLGAPPASAPPEKWKGAVAILVLLSALLPLLALSLVALWLFDRLLLPRMPRLAQWLGATPAHASA